MNEPWLKDLLASLAHAAIVGGSVLIFGGPYWAAVGFGWVVYLWSPRTFQLRARLEAEIEAARRDIDSIRRGR